MRCGIATITIGCNYGNRLQNLALQETIETMGGEVETIDYKPCYRKLDSSKDTSTSNKIKVSERVFSLQRKILGKIYHFRNVRLLNEKSEKFGEFNKNYINFSQERYTIKSDLSEMVSRYDFMVAGSDQIWNPYWEGANPFYFLGFMPERARIAYAASFGVSNIPSSCQKDYAESLEGIRYLSCREKRGVEIIDELSEKRAVQVLDPTMLLEKSQWEKYEKKPICQQVESPYILVYFLGEISNAEYRKMKQYEKKLKAKLLFVDGYKWSNTITASPTEFIYLIHHAKMICTDSFHGCVFSILFEKSFVCFERELDKGKNQEMSSRLTSLFETFKCEDRYASKVGNEFMKVDYTKINNILLEERKKSKEFLYKALRGKSCEC